MAERAAGERFAHTPAAALQYKRRQALSADFNSSTDQSPNNGIAA
jgi:hypothetical protein